MELSILLPVLHGETLGSYYTRTSQLGRRGRRATAEHCFGRKWAAVDWLLPTHLDTFAERVGVHLGHGDARYWSNKHTLAPLYAATLRPGQRGRFYQRLAKVTNGRRAPLVALSCEEWLAPHPKLCPECDDENVRTHGFSFVQRMWMAPFATRCHIHREPLRAYPDWSPLERGECLETSSHRGRAKEGVWLARRLSDLVFDGEGTLDRLGALMASRGQLQRSGKVRRSSLISLVERHVQGRSDHIELDEMLRSRASIERLLSPLWNPRVTLHPVVAIYLERALTDEPEVQLQLPYGDTRSKRNVPLPAGTVQGARSATQVARDTGVSTTTAVVKLLASGSSVNLRPKRLQPDRRRRIERLLAGGRTVDEVVRLTGFSNSTVYRVLRSNAELRQSCRARRDAAVLMRYQKRWLQLVRKHPNESLTQLRKRAPGGFTFLYRHSRKWLYQVTPKSREKRATKAPKSRTPAGAKAALANNLSRASREIEHVRRSQSRLLARAMKRSVKSAKATEDINTKTLLKSLEESKDAFVLRRLKEGAAKVLGEGKSLMPWRVLKASGLRDSTVSQSSVKLVDAIAEFRAERLWRDKP